MSPRTRRDEWRGKLAHLFSRRWSQALLVLVTAGLLWWNAAQWWRLRPGGKAPPQAPNAVICTRCGWQGWRVTTHMPQRCPRCHQMSVHFAGICPECRTWMPWSLPREEQLLAHPRLFMDLGPAYFFPKCRECGAQTTPRGAAAGSAPAAAYKRTVHEHGTLHARGERR